MDDNVIELKKIVEQRIEYEKEHFLENKGKEIELDKKYVINCINVNKMGDGIMYATLNKGKFVYCSNYDEWFRRRTVFHQFSVHRSVSISL